MTASSTTPADEAPSLASRLGESCVELRSDLETSRHVFRGEICYILLDPINFRSHRFSLADYRILASLTADRPLAEIFTELRTRDHLQEEDEERFYEFVFSLHSIGFLNLPISDETSLYRRHQARKQAKRAHLLKSILFLQIPLFGPDAFLSRTAAFARPFFTRWAFLIWIASIATAGLVVTRNWAEFTEPVGDIFRNENLPLLWVSLIVLKVAHEFGHAYATKLLGGRVSEMGIFLMIFTPCAYVDASATWGFSRKRDRLIVCLAGMYVELFIAALAVLAWSVFPPGLWRSVLHNVVLLASVVTIGFNLNPLMRFDGYYVLSDLVEIPNLRARSRECVTSALKRLMLGVRSTTVEGGGGRRLFLFGFGTSSAIYKVCLVLGISATIATKFPALGLLLGGAYLSSELLGILRRTIPYLWNSAETSSVRPWAVTLALLIVGGIPISLAAIPVPSSVTTTGVLSARTEVFLRAETSGFLESLSIESGSRISEHQRVLQLEDVEVVSRLEEVEARVTAARVALEQSRALDPASVVQHRERVQLLEHERDRRQRDLDRLSILSPVTGTAIACLDRNQLGRFVKRGELVASIVSGTPVVHTLLSEEELVAADPAVGTPVEFRTAAQPGRVIQGRVRRVVPTGRREFDQRFALHLDPASYAVNPTTGKATRSQFEVEVELVEPDGELLLSRGLTGKLRLAGETAPIGLWMWRRALTFANRLTG